MTTLTEELQTLKQFVEKQPPRPGLVPQSGDPQHPGRWIRPSDGPRGPQGPREMTSEAENAARYAGSEASKTLKEAIRILTQQFRGDITPEKAGFAAGTLWQNMESARKHFKNRKEFQQSVEAAARIALA